jgi:hypothetical protein
MKNMQTALLLGRQDTGCKSQVRIDILRYDQSYNLCGEHLEVCSARTIAKSTFSLAPIPYS